jgi:hypothetical protein
LVLHATLLLERLLAGRGIDLRSDVERMGVTSVAGFQWTP